MADFFWYLIILRSRRAVSAAMQQYMPARIKNIVYYTLIGSFFQVFEINIVFAANGQNTTKRTKYNQKDCRTFWQQSPFVILRQIFGRTTA